jgi:diaminopropionate ammonia-lyase
VAALRERLAGRPLLACATEGNHGRAVAWTARLLGLPARVLVPADTVAARRAAIAGEGAQVEVVDGSYDDAVERAAALAGPDTLVVQDTGDGDVPRWVIDGYATIGAEIDVRPDVVAVQIGVGSFAAAIVRSFAGARLIGVEPLAAACALASAEAGRRVEVPVPHHSVMVGLSSGCPSPVAWPVLAAGIETFVAIADERAHDAVALLARDGITAGESGAAGLAGLLAFRDELALPADATVLVINTEGRTG